MRSISGLTAFFTLGIATVAAGAAFAQPVLLSRPTGATFGPGVSRPGGATFGPGVTRPTGAILGPGVSRAVGASPGPGVVPPTGAMFGPGVTRPTGATFGPGVTRPTGTLLGPGVTRPTGALLGPGVIRPTGATFGPGVTRAVGATQGPGVERPTGPTPNPNEIVRPTGPTFGFTFGSPFPEPLGLVVLPVVAPTLPMGATGSMAGAFVWGMATGTLYSWLLDPDQHDTWRLFDRPEDRARRFATSGPLPRWSPTMERDWTVSGQTGTGPEWSALSTDREWTVSGRAGYGPDWSALRE